MLKLILKLILKEHNMSFDPKTPEIKKICES